MTQSMVHICVCICTYRRPASLRQLLSALDTLETGGKFTYSAVIVDNDSQESARQVVERHARDSGYSIKYVVEREQNISLARNRALGNATGDFVAFIDDDEFPSPTWLLNHLSAFNAFRPTGGVLGPVIPFYPEGTPSWLIKSGICDRINHDTGTLLDWNMTRTGNVLLSRAIVCDERFLFEKRFGRTGGGDKRFFRTLMEQGYSFIWCQDAEVFETVLPERWKLSFYLHRSLMAGGYVGKGIGAKSPKYFLRSLGSFCYYFVKLFISLPRGKPYLYKHFIRVVYDFGRITGAFGFQLVKNRPEQVKIPS